MSTATFNWRLQAACLGADRETFFGPEGEHPDERQAREAEARAYCGRCLVAAPCLDFRLSFERQADDGIWAGKDGDERAALRHALVKRIQRRAA